eukprot:gene32570-44372_t
MVDYDVRRVAVPKERSDDVSNAAVDPAKGEAEAEVGDRLRRG